MEPYSDMVEQALSNLYSPLLHLNPFGQQENDDVQVELTDSLVDDIENQSDDEAVSLDDISSFPANTTPTLMPDVSLML